MWWVRRTRAAKAPDRPAPTMVMLRPLVGGLFAILVGFAERDAEEKDGLGEDF